MLIESHHATIFDGISNVSTIFTILEIFTVEMRITLTFSIGKMSNVNMLIESTYATLYLVAIVMIAISVKVSEISAVEICITLTLTCTIG